MVKMSANQKEEWFIPYETIGNNFWYYQRFT